MDNLKNNSEFPEYYPLKDGNLSGPVDSRSPKNLEQIVSDYIKKVDSDKRRKIKLYEIFPSLGFKRLKPDTALGKIGNFIKKEYGTLISTGLVLGLFYFMTKAAQAAYEFHYVDLSYPKPIPSLRPIYNLYALIPLAILGFSQVFDSDSIDGLKRAFKYGSFALKTALGFSYGALYLGFYTFFTSIGRANRTGLTYYYKYHPELFSQKSLQLLHSYYKNLNTFSILTSAMMTLIVMPTLLGAVTSDSFSLPKKSFSKPSPEEITKRVNELKELVKYNPDNSEAILALELDKALYVDKTNFKNVMNAFNRRQDYSSRLTPLKKLSLAPLTYLSVLLYNAGVRRKLRSVKSKDPSSFPVAEIEGLVNQVRGDVWGLNLIPTTILRKYLKKDLHKLVDKLILRLKPYLTGVRDAKAIEHIIRFNSFLYPTKEGLPPEEVSDEVGYLIKGLGSQNKIRVDSRMSKGGKEIFVTKPDFLWNADSQIFVKAANEKNSKLVNRLRDEYYALRFMLRLDRGTEFYKNKTIPLFFGKTKINGEDVVTLVTSMVKGIPLPEYLKLFENSEKLVLEQNEVVLHRILRLSNLLTSHLDILPHEELSAIKVMNIEDFTNKKLFVRLFNIYSYMNKYFSPELSSKADFKKLEDKKMRESINNLITEFDELNPKSDYVVNDSDATAGNIICPTGAEDKINKKNYHELEKNSVIVDPRLKLGSIVELLYNSVSDPRNYLSGNNQSNLANYAVRSTVKSARLFKGEKRLKQSFETYRAMADLTTAIMFMDYGIKKIAEKDFVDADDFISKAHSFLLKLEPDRADKALYFKAELTGTQKDKITNFLTGVQPLKNDLIKITDTIKKEKITDYERFLKKYS